MKSQSPALTKGALVATAGRKTHKVQRQLQEAEAGLQVTNRILAQAKAKPTPDQQQIDVAAQQSVAAEEKVHDATEELQVVKELLSEAEAEAEAEAAGQAAAKARPGPTGQSGDGVKSLIPHLERARSRVTD
jgi:hypothetical protein